MKQSLFILIFIFVCSDFSFAQQNEKILLLEDGDSNKVAKIAATDTNKIKTGTTLKPKHDPRKATRRSLMLPGWGQIYNKQYWKLPLVYGAIGTATGIWIYNNTWYRRTKFAYNAMYKAEIENDPSDLPKIHPKIKNLNLNSASYYRNQFRKNRDYSTLWFLIAWGAQVADATVFAHLKDFDVSDDLSVNITPNYSPVTMQPGVSLAFKIKDKKERKVTAR